MLKDSLKYINQDSLLMCFDENESRCLIENAEKEECEQECHQEKYAEPCIQEFILELREASHENIEVTDDNGA